MKQKVETDKAPKADHILSQAVDSNGFVFVSGQVHVKPDGKLVEGSTADKVHQIMKNIEAILNATSANFDDIVKVTVYMSDMKLGPELNEVYPTYFSGPLPAREMIGVSELPLGASIEISVIANKG